jgi:hypothetical protein
LYCVMLNLQLLKPIVNLREKSKKTKKTKCDLSYKTGPFITFVLATFIIQEAQERRLWGPKVLPTRSNSIMSALFQVHNFPNFPAKYHSTMQLQNMFVKK